MNLWVDFIENHYVAIRVKVKLQSQCAGTWWPLERKNWMEWQRQYIENQLTTNAITGDQKMSRQYVMNLMIQIKPGTFFSPWDNRHELLSHIGDDSFWWSCSTSFNDPFKFPYRNISVQDCIYRVPVGASERGSIWPEQWPLRLEKPLYEVRLSGWFLWKSSSSGIHCWLRALEKRSFPPIFEWNGYKLAFSKKHHGHECCLWRVRYSTYLCIFWFPCHLEFSKGPSIFEMQINYFCLSFFVYIWLKNLTSLVHLFLFSPKIVPCNSRRNMSRHSTIVPNNFMWCLHYAGMIISFN